MDVEHREHLAFRVNVAIQTARMLPSPVDDLAGFRVRWPDVVALVDEITTTLDAEPPPDP